MQQQTQDPATPPVDPQRCRNCGAPAGPRFCGDCGQEIEDHRSPIGQLLREVLSEWFSLDGHLFRTLKALSRPGRLTKLYLSGKRARYLRPVRLYAIASLALFSSVLSLEPPSAARVALSIAGEQVTTPRSGDGSRTRVVLFEPDSLALTWLARQFPGRLAALRAMPPQTLLHTLFGGLKAALPALLILFLPFLALGLKVLYVRTGTLFVDHLVFAVHVQSALFLALALAWLAARVAGLGPTAVMLLCGLGGLSILTAYMALSLRRVYAQPWWLTLAKTLLVLFVYARLLGLVVGAAVIFAVFRL
jgi:hypothetical protein